MIISVRGTSGSGKTHLVREVARRYRYRAPVFLPPEGMEWDTLKRGRMRMDRRRNPLLYVLGNESGGRALSIIGSYESACGGCDTIPQTDLVFHLVRNEAAAGNDVLFEGLLLGGETLRTKTLTDVLVVGLTTPLEVCLASINSRRRLRDPEAEDVNPKNTVAKMGHIESALKHLAEFPGITVCRADREEALQIVLEALGF